jgi:TonB-linked SusC/RagA family outer membrane protein
VQKKRRKRVVNLSVCAAMNVALTAFVSMIGAAQSPVTDAGPRFVLVSNSHRGEITLDVSRTPVLKQRISLDLRAATIKEALAEIVKEAGFALFYSDDVLPAENRVSLRAENITVAAALTDVLGDAEVDIVFNESGRAALRKRPLPPPQASVVGQVTDSASGAPLGGVQVRVEGTRLSAISAESGRYRIEGVPVGPHTMVARRLGYAQARRNVSVALDQEAVLDFALTKVAAALEDVVTTMTGAQRRVEVGNVIGTINADSVVREAPVTSLTDVLNARVPGAQVIMNGGYTGSSPRIRIRGVSSITGSNDPLIIIDGVRVENSVAIIAGYGQTSGRLNDLNPEEIESLEVVKGPSAATLYGTDAANGVIVVTTKRGRAGRPVWNTYLETGHIDPAAKYPASYYSWGRNTTTNAVQQCVLIQVAAGTCTIDSLTTLNLLLDPATSPFSTGSRSQYGAQVSGGASQLTYFLSGEYEGETGTLRMPTLEQERIKVERGGAAIPEEQLRPNAMRKISLRGNTTAPLGSKADVSLSVGLAALEDRIPSNSVVFSALSGRGYLDSNKGWFSTQPGEQFGLRNAEHVTHFMGSLRGSWRPLSWLSANATLGTDFSATFLDALQRRNEGPFGSGRNGRRQNIQTDVKLYTGDIGASANFALSPRVTSRTSIGVQYNQRQLNASTAIGTNLPPGSETVAGAAIQTVAEQNITSAVAGGYAEQMIGLDERIFLTGALRADGAASFGRDFKTAVYPKAGLSWLALTERSGILNNIRIRSAYGASGVQPSSTAALALITVFPVLVDGTAASGAAQSAIGNPGLKPERSSEWEVGTDASMFAERVRIELTHYDRLSRSALIDRPLPTSFGFASRQENIGSVRNRGFELLASVRAIDAQSLKWDLSINGSTNHNRLERIGANVSFVGASSAQRNREGYPMFGIWDRPILGFEDANGNGIIEANEVEVGDTAVFLGSSVPSKQFTFSSTVTLPHGVRISTQFDYRGGFDQLDTEGSGRCSALLNCRDVNDPSAPLDRQAAAVAATNASLGRTSFGYIGDASFVRWRELSLALDIPDRVARTVGSRRASLVVAGRNLKLFTKYRGLDPEKNSTLNFAEGFNDNASAPPARSWILRLNLDF